MCFVYAGKTQVNIELVCWLKILLCYTNILLNIKKKILMLLDNINVK